MCHLGLPYFEAGKGGGGVGELSTYPDLLLNAGYYPAIIGKTNFNPVPTSFLFKDGHSGNSDMRCSTNKYADGECDIAEADFLETYLVNRSLEHIDNVTRDRGVDQPWFLHLSFISPHPPSTPPRPWDLTYTADQLPTLDYEVGDIEGLPGQTRMLLGLEGADPAVDSRAKNWLLPDGRANMTYIDADRMLYYGLAAYVDEQVGRMLDGLEARGLTERTLVIFTSDHGSMLFDHGIDDDKHAFLDASWHVPFILRLPGVLPANVTRGFAIVGPDVTATILGAAGAANLPDDPTSALARLRRGATLEAATDPSAAPLPNVSMAANTSFYMSGFDLFTPLALDAGAPSPRTAAVGVEYRGFAVASARWKLSYFPVKGEGRLYDRVADPRERRDLWPTTNATLRGVRDALLIALLRWRARQDDLQYEAVHWTGGGTVGARAKNDTLYLTGISAELDLQADLAAIDLLTLA